MHPRGRLIPILGRAPRGHRLSCEAPRLSDVVRPVRLPVLQAIAGSAIRTHARTVGEMSDLPYFVTSVKQALCVFHIFTLFGR